MPVNIGRGTVNLYPVIDQSMATHEHAHAFHINKTALSSQNIDLRAQLDALGHQLNLSATVDGIIMDGEDVCLRVMAAAAPTLGPSSKTTAHERELSLF